VFGLDGADYEIDLSAKNAQPSARTRRFVERARMASHLPAPWTARTSPDRQRSSEVPPNAKDQGTAVSARGRIMASVIEDCRTATRRLSRALAAAKAGGKYLITERERSL
jgi:hypothetical protein